MINQFMKLLKLFKFTIYILPLLGNAQIKKPNIVFILMDDLGYGQFGPNNDKLKVSDFDPYFVHLVDSLQGYSKEKSIDFTKFAVPTLSKLSNAGIRFTNAFATSNICAPSRCGIASGTMQNRFGVYVNEDGEEAGLVPGTHLAAKLQQNNYATAHIGKWHIGKRDIEIVKNILWKNGINENASLSIIAKQYPKVHEEIVNSGYWGSVVKEQHPLTNGFDFYFGYNYWASDFYNSKRVWENYKHAGAQKGYNTDVFTDKALAFMDEQVGINKPFYVQLHYHAVHDSLEPMAPAKYLNKFKSDSFTLNNFYAHINGVDENVKRIVEYLKSKNEYENTIIIFTSDNGAMVAGTYDGHKTGSPLPGNAPYAGHKGTYMQGGIRVPMFIHWPAGIKKPAVIKQLVSAMDILPTALDVAGVTQPENLDGRSLKPMFTDNSYVVHDKLVWAGIHSYKWGYLIKKTNKSHGTEVGFAPASWLIIKDGYMLRFTGKFDPNVYKENMNGRESLKELFNLNADPSETKNIADKMPEKVNELSNQYFLESKDFKPSATWPISKWKQLQPAILNY